MKEKTDIWLQVWGDIDPRFIEEARQLPQKPARSHRRLYQWGSLVAVVLLCVSLLPQLQSDLYINTLADPQILPPANGLQGSPTMPSVQEDSPMPKESTQHIPQDQTALADYFGMDFAGLALPAGLVYWDMGTQQDFEETLQGVLVYDTAMFFYENEDSHASLTLRVSKLGYPLDKMDIPQAKESQIGATPVLVWEQAGRVFAQGERAGVFFDIEAQGLSKRALERALHSILDTTS